MHGTYTKNAKILFDIYIYFPRSNKSKGSALSLRSQFITHFRLTALSWYSFTLHSTVATKSHEARAVMFKHSTMCPHNVFESPMILRTNVDYLPEIRFQGVKSKDNASLLSKHPLTAHPSPLCTRTCCRGGGDKMCNYTCSFPKFTLNRERPHSWKSMMNGYGLCRIVII